ncbi:alpha/beta fold hydrolase [Mycobacterium sp. NAZ190054]|uniref:alpha/beta fold hydrolase n=1 Tax=Mycobacterium sp. NAZ190054 TaxID=1747766 RepID=UPI0007954314|nr:alpha/beta fold hydrolase [Mycobacterium sp. NAZ190054]KWX67330.1 hypothetical protein ASJ79_22105 [Mycobacterium sp. NAZ190054]
MTDLADVDHELCEVAPGVCLRVLRYEPQGGSRGTIVFIHGLGATAERWTQTMRACAAVGFRSLAIDLPGHGFSTKGRLPDFSIPGFLQYLQVARTKLGAQTATLVGTSLGAHLVAAATVADPDRTERIVLVGPIGITPVPEDIRQQLAQNITDTSPAGITAKLYGLLHDPALVTPEWVATECEINNSPGADESFALLAGYVRDRYNHDIVGDALRSAAGDVPCTLIWGAADRMVPPDQAHHILRLLPDHTRLHLIDKAGHAPYFERPAEFNKILLDFLPT